MVKFAGEVSSEFERSGVYFHLVMVIAHFSREVRVPSSPLQSAMPGQMTKSRVGMRGLLPISCSKSGKNEFFWAGPLTRTQNSR